MAEALGGEGGIRTLVILFLISSLRAQASKMLLKLNCLAWPEDAAATKQHPHLRMA